MPWHRTHGIQHEAALDHLLGLSGLHLWRLRHLLCGRAHREIQQSSSERPVGSKRETAFLANEISPPPTYFIYVFLFLDQVRTATIPGRDHLQSESNQKESSE